MAAGGVYLLDVLVVTPDVARRKTAALREQAARTEHAVTWALRMEERRLLTLCRNTARLERGLAEASPEAFGRRAAELPDVDAAWIRDPNGCVRRVWARDDRPLSATEIRGALSALGEPGEAPTTQQGTAIDSGLLHLGETAAVFAGTALETPGQADRAPMRLYLARRLDVGLLGEVGASIPAELVLVEADRLPDNSDAEDLGCWSVWPLSPDHLAVAWPARDTAGAPIGYFRARLGARQVLGQAAAMRQTTLIVLSLSAGAVLLVIVGAGIFLANPIRGLVRRLHEVESGQRTIDELSDGLHAEPLILARKLQSALESMSELSLTDEMTGLANRRQFDHTLDSEFHQARRYKRPLSVMVMDIDLFKAVNDTKGHQAGDWVIKVIAEIIRRGCRKADLPVRLGGDEFAVLLPETRAASAAVVAERIRKGVHEEPVIIDGTEMNVTLSIGVADMEAGKIEKAEDLVGLADEALYAAKQLGRDRFVLASEMEEDDWADASEENDRVEMLRGKLAGLDTQFKSLFVRALQEIVRAMERRDPHMADHARKVQHYSSLMGKRLNLSEDLIRQIEMAALLHDIGMLALPDAVLLCPGASTRCRSRRCAATRSSVRGSWRARSSSSRSSRSCASTTSGSTARATPRASPGSASRRSAGSSPLPMRSTP